MKKTFFAFVLLNVLFYSCKKENNNLLSETKINNAPQTRVYSRVDTTSHTEAVSKSFGKTLKMLTASNGAYLTTYYQGIGYYSLTVKEFDSNQYASVAYSILKDEQVIETGTIYNGVNDFTITRLLSPGVYYLNLRYYGIPGATHSTNSITIYAQPTAPPGMLCLYRYFSSNYSAHFYTTDWEELGSTSQGYTFEKVTAYVYPNGTTGYIPLYRYYSPNYADHYYTTTFGTYPMYNYEWIQCTVAATPTGTMTTALNQYYNPTLADHFYCIGPETPTGTGWSYEKVACYVQKP